METQQTQLDPSDSFAGFQLFDAIAIAIGFFFSLSFVEQAFLSPTAKWPALIAILFFAALYLKRFDPVYQRGAKIIWEEQTLFTFIGVYLFGPLLCGFMFFLYVYKNVLGSISPTLFSDQSILFLPLLVLAIAYVPVLYHQALKQKNPKQQSDKPTELTPFQLFTTTALLLQSGFILAWLGQQFAGIVGDYDVMVTVIGTALLTAVFYLPARVHFMFMTPEANHWRSFVQTVIAFSLMQLGVPYF